MNGAAPNRRRGTTLIELTACVTVLVIAAALTTKVVVALAAQARELDRRAIALREADNLLERLAAADPDSWQARAEAAEEMSESARSALPSGAMTSRIDPPADGLSRVVVEVRWETRPGRPSRPVRLATWRAAP